MKLLAAILCVSLIGCSRRAAEEEKVWYGPATLDTVTRGIRHDFLPMFTNADNWPSVLRASGVFKQFIETLGGQKYSKEQLEQLAGFAKTAGLRCAFEVGVLRWSADLHGLGSGKVYASQEVEKLQRWVEAGGSVDYLSTDHAVMWNVGLCLQGSRPMAGLADPDWRKILAEVCDGLAVMHQAFPRAKIGMIESLGYFSVGEHYKTTDPQNLYAIDYETFIRAAQKELRARGIELDHVHIDFSYQDCLHDGRRENRADFGRIIAAEQINKSLGIKSGIIINAFDDFSNVGTNIVQEQGKAENRIERGKSAARNTMAYLDGYLAAGGDPDTWIIQRWQPYPDVTGPETVPDTDMGIARGVLQRLQSDGHLVPRK